MSWYLVAPLAGVAMLAAAEGIAAVRTGWVLPWQRSRVFRPRLWGYASLLIAACLALQTAGAVWDGPEAHVLFSGLGVTGALIALAMMWVARRSTRVR
ncbi:hypothetical protein ACFO9E_10200 [Streptomyces maoxianensis]|uniref:Uncharacterized protein n=1 Tax=Streptomyces maoxianensis TaxID=1459942 RepID=A0ABV9G6K5_9ACTN